MGDNRTLQRLIFAFATASSCLTYEAWAQERQDPRSLQAQITLDQALLQKYPALAKLAPVVQLSAGANSYLFGLSNDGSPYLWNGSAWQKLPGNLAQMASRSSKMSNGKPLIELWGVTPDGSVVSWVNGTWQTMPGGVIQVAMAKSGNEIYGLTPTGGAVRWMNNSWTPIAPPPVAAGSTPVAFLQLGAASDAHLFALSRGGEIYRYTLGNGQWIKLAGPAGGKAARLVLGLDGTLGMIDSSGKFFLRQAQDVDREVNTPPDQTAVPHWMPQGDASGADVLDTTTSLTIDSQGSLVQSYTKISPPPTRLSVPKAPADPLVTGGLTIVSSTVTVTTSAKNSQVVTLLDQVCDTDKDGNQICRPAAELQKTPEPGKCIAISANGVLNPPPQQRQTSDQQLTSFKCKTGTFSKIVIVPPPVKEIPPTGNLNTVLTAPHFPSAYVGQSFAVTAPNGPDCSPKVFGVSSGQTWAEFRLPIASDGKTIQIPAGGHAKYVFPACHRAYWTDLTFSCSAGAWKLAAGRYDSDGGCSANPKVSPYVVFGDK